MTYKSGRGIRQTCKSCLKLFISQCTSVYLFEIGNSQFRVFNLTITSFFLSMYFMID